MIIMHNLNEDLNKNNFPVLKPLECTVHKVQGLSINKAVISFKLNRQKAFNQGQMYVALIRLTRIANMYLVGEYSQSAIRVNVAAKLEYERLRNDCTLSPLRQTSVSKSSLTLTLLNVHSLRKHVSDIMKDIRLIDSDFLCLTETQLDTGQDTSEITSAFIQHGISIDYNSNVNKFKSLAFCSNNNCVVLIQHDKYDGVSCYPSFALSSATSFSFHFL